VNRDNGVGPGWERDVPLPELLPDDDGGPPLALVRPEVSDPVEAEGRRPRFHLYTLDELLQLPPLTWLLDRHIPENALAVLYGPPGSGKSFLALAWSLAVALHQPWLGCPTSRGSVVYVAAEGGSGLGQRVQAYRNAHELAGPTNIWFVREPLNLLQSDLVSALLADVDAALDEHPGLFVFDTMARCMAGGDENSAQDVGTVIAAADRIRRETNAAVLFVHHTGKDGLSERGSSALRGAADCMFALKNEEYALTLTCEKQKDAVAVEPRPLRLVAVEPSCVIEPLEGSPVEPGTLTRRGREALRTIAEIGDSSATVWLKSARLSEPIFYRTIKLLLDSGYVVKVKGRYSLTDLGRSTLNGNYQ
jgi:KaiC/GvpD/RAD55 family RecA-like ATPase